MQHSKKGDSDDGSGLSAEPYDNKAARKRSKQKQWIFANNATLLNLPKQPAEEVKTAADHAQSSRDSKRPTVMELMRTHFHSNKPLLLPSEQANMTSPQPASSEGPMELMSPSESYITTSLHKATDTAITNETYESTAISSQRRLSGDYDNVAIQQKPFERGSTGARSSFHAIKAFFDGNSYKTPVNDGSYEQTQTVADIHVISNNALMGNSNTRYSHRDGASEPSTIPRFPNMRLPPVHGKFHGLPGASGDSVSSQGHAKFLNSFGR